MDDHTPAHVPEARVTGHTVEIEGTAITIGTAIADSFQLSIETDKFDDTYPNKLSKREAF